MSKEQYLKFWQDFYQKHFPNLEIKWEGFDIPERQNGDSQLVIVPNISLSELIKSLRKEDGYKIFCYVDADWTTSYDGLITAVWINEDNDVIVEA